MKKRHIYSVDLSAYFKQLFILLRPKQLEYFRKIEFKLYFDIEDPTQIHMKYRFNGYRYEKRVLHGLAPDMFVDIINFFVMLGEGSRDVKEITPEWMYEPRAWLIHGLIKDALDIPHYTEIRKHLFKRGVSVDLECPAKADLEFFGDDSYKHEALVRPSLIYWREVQKVLLATNSLFETADYDDPEVNYDGRD